MKKIEYCIHCGTRIEDDKAERCPHCHARLDISENVFRYFLIRQVKENAEEKIEDTTFNLLKSYLKSHLYGILLSLVIVTGVVTGVRLHRLDADIQALETRASILTQTTASDELVEEEPVIDKEAEMYTEFNRLFALAESADAIYNKYIYGDIVVDYEIYRDGLLGDYQFPDSLYTDAADLQAYYDDIMPQLEAFETTYAEYLNSTDEEYADIQERYGYLKGFSADTVPMLIDMINHAVGHLG